MADDTNRAIIDALPTVELPDTNGGNMDTQRIVSILSDLRSNFNCFYKNDEPYYRALSEAIEAVKAEPSAELPDICVGDTISRQAAIDVLDVLCQEHRYKIPGKVETYSQYNEAWQDALDRAQGVIFNLPSAERKGHWIYGEDEYGIDGYRCDECGFFVPWDYKHKSINFIEDYNFCPNCGADMRGEQ